MKERPKRISSEQSQAIELCIDMDNRIVGVTGSAGTGKTFVLGHVHAELVKKVGKERIVLCAPTGRAAKRIQELTGIQAVTLHRLLQFPTPDEPPEEGDPPPNLPRRHAGNPLVQRVVLVDEASMVSNEIFDFLMDAMPPKAVVRFFGDNQQLAPVEEKNSGPPPFYMILDNEPSVRLTYNFRSDDAIVSNAQNILRGMLPKRNERFEVVYDSNPIEALIEIAGGAPEFMRIDHQVIMPMRKNNGTMRVNPSLQMKLNPKGDVLRLKRHDFKEAPLAVRAGDKFLWIKNDYNLALFNGEIGQITQVDEESGQVDIKTPDRELPVPPLMKYYDRRDMMWKSYDPRKQIELGYAITTHKSQGSEFDTIIYCISQAMYYGLNKRNLYTAVTRAKHRVILISDSVALGMSLRKKT